MSERKLSGFRDRRLTYDIACEPEDLEIEGNASAWGEPEDTVYADKIRRELESGNEWAWCMVVVRCTFEDADGNTWEGRDNLGGCSYTSEAMFKRGGYWADMKRQAFDDMVSKMEAASKRGDAARKTLPAVV